MYVRDKVRVQQAERCKPHHIFASVPARVIVAGIVREISIATRYCERDLYNTEMYCVSLAVGRRDYKSWGQADDPDFATAFFPR